MPSRVLILGLPYFGRMLAETLRPYGWETDYRAHPGRDPRAWAGLLPAVARAGVVYLISSRIDRWSPQSLLAAVRRRPIVIHWVGTDVLFALDEYRAGRASERLISRATHFADAPWLVDELAEIGIEAEYLPLPVAGLHTGEPPPLPAAFRVLLYYPLDALERENFDWDTMLRLTREFPEIEFQLVASPPETLPAPPPPNLHATGWVDDLGAIYPEVTVYIRLTEHDGTSFMAVESLSRGRYVIWTHPMAGAIEARGFDQVSAALGDLWRRHQRGDLPLNHAGRASALRDFDPDRLASALHDRLSRTVGTRS